MGRKRNPNREKAFALWIDSATLKPLKEIAQELGELETSIRKWKCQDKWETLSRIAIMEAEEALGDMKGLESLYMAHDTEDDIQEESALNEEPKPTQPGENLRLVSDNANPIKPAKQTQKNKATGSANEFQRLTKKQIGICSGIYSLTQDETDYLAAIARMTDTQRLDLVYSAAALKFKRMTGQIRESSYAEWQSVELEALDTMRKAAADKHKIITEDAKIEIARAKLGLNKDDNLDGVNILVDYDSAGSETK